MNNGQRSLVQHEALYRYKGRRENKLLFSLTARRLFFTIVFTLDHRNYNTTHHREINSNSHEHHRPQQREPARSSIVHRPPAGPLDPALGTGPRQGNMSGPHHNDPFYQETSSSSSGLAQAHGVAHGGQGSTSQLNVGGLMV